MTPRGRLEADVRVTRGGFSAEISLPVAAGTTVALLGRNGSGKSTVVAALAGLLPLTGGRIAVDGVVLDDPAARVFVPAERRPVGAVLQQAALFPHLTARDNVAFGLPRRARAAADSALAEAGLAGLARRRPAQLSGGQAARVALVRTLVRQPAFVVLDEPLAAVDADARPALRAAIRSALEAFAGSALLVTHDPADAEALADEVVVLDAGRVLQRGTLAAVRAAPAGSTVARLTGAGLRS